MSELALPKDDAEVPGLVGKFSLGDLQAWVGVRRRLNDNSAGGPAHMRMVYWLFVVSAALFVSGIGFIVAGARTTQRGPAPPEAPELRPVGSVKQIMIGIVQPAASVVFGSVGTIISAAGTVEKSPKTEEEWAEVGSSAVALAESANLLVMGDRAVDRGDWVTMSRALADAGMETLKATEAKSTEGVLAAGAVVNQTCDNCHRKYQRE